LVLTILEMQPRQTGGGKGKSTDTIVYEMSAGILDRVIDKLDIDEARADMFEVSSNYFTISVNFDGDGPPSWGSAILGVCHSGDTEGLGLR